jgi:hypothetical protein
MRFGLLLVLLAAPSFAAPGGTGSRGLLSVLELRNKLQGPDKANVDAAYLGDRIRNEILDSPLDVKVMTRENMLVLLESQGKTLEQCEGECEVDTGRRLGADYVLSGEVLRSGKQLKLTLKLHETREGMLVSGTTCGGAEVDELDAAIKAAVLKLVEPLLPRAPQPAQPPVQAAAPVPVAQAVGSVRMAVAAPPEGRWSLVTEAGEKLCPLPCTRPLARDALYFAETDGRKLALPAPADFVSGKSVEAEYVPGRGNRTLGTIGAIAGAGALAAGVALFATSKTQCWVTLTGGAVQHNGGACPPPPLPLGILSQETVETTKGAGTILGAAGLAVLSAGIGYLLWSIPESFQAR